MKSKVLYFNRTHYNEFLSGLTSDGGEVRHPRALFLVLLAITALEAALFWKWWIA